MCVCVCECVSVCERERLKDTDRQAERQGMSFTHQGQTNLLFPQSVGRNSSVGIATRYGLYGPEI